jgi:hypothetical protein
MAEDADANMRTATPHVPLQQPAAVIFASSMAEDADVNMPLEMLRALVRLLDQISAGGTAEDADANMRTATPRVLVEPLHQPFFASSTEEDIDAND